MQTMWGPWVLNPTEMTLTHSGNDYWIDLDKCRNSAEILDWIAQVKGKEWGTAPTIWYLLHAMDYICNGLQWSVCGLGLDHQINPRDTLEVRARTTEWITPSSPIPVDTSTITLSFKASHFEEFLRVLLAPTGTGCDDWAMALNGLRDSLPANSAFDSIRRELDETVKGYNSGEFRTAREWIGFFKELLHPVELRIAEDEEAKELALRGEMAQRAWEGD